jgi:Restriction endonuclease S subunits
MKSKYIDATLTKMSDFAAEQMQLFPPHSLLFVVRSGILRRTLPIAILRTFATVNQDLKVASFYLSEICEYCYYYFSAMEKEILTKYQKDGTTVESINFDDFKEISLSLPPIAEQYRIVAAIKLAFTKIDEIERNKAELQVAIAAAKSKILSLAIRGKLVPQDPSDEPASVMLERIRAEREQLIKAGKIKRNKNESVITKGDDNSYYEKVPDGWAIYPIEKLFSTIGGGTPSTSIAEYWGEGVPWFSSADIDEAGNISTRRYVTQLGIDNSTTNVVQKGSAVVVTRVGLGKVAVLTYDMCFSQDNQALKPYYPELVYHQYLYYFLLNAMQTLKYSGRGTTISGITKKQLTDTQIWLPPIAEQHRIVNAIESVYKGLNEITESLS